MDSSLVTWNPAGVAAWAEAEPERAVMVMSLRGFVDAGKAGALFSEHLHASSEPIRVLDFDVDSLLDYRSRRPEMVFSVNEWTSYAQPKLGVDLLRDGEGKPFLHLHGPEPDFRWEAFVKQVRIIMQKLQVEVLVGGHGIPMAVPHTRPLLVTLHANKQDLLPTTPSMFGTVTVPGSVAALTELRLREWDMAALNVGVHVPYYLAQAELPEAAAKIASELGILTELDFQPENFADAVAMTREELQGQINDNDEVHTLIATLEGQYDKFLESREAGLGFDAPLPSADEIAADFEKFLAQQRKDLPPNT